MKRRDFSLLAAAAAGAPLATLGGCGGGGAAEVAAEGGARETVAAGATARPTPRLARWRASPNPTGLRVGFWENYDRQGLTLSTMGARPSSRVGFNAWDVLDPPDGPYMDPPSAPYAIAHQYGEGLLAAINLCFRIPGRYAQDIADGATTAAAEGFLAHHVRWLLESFGSMVLTIDYEIVSNYLLAGSPTMAEVERRADAWQDWYVNHAAPTARRVAQEVAQAQQRDIRLTLQPIFNGNPLADGHPVRVNAKVIAALRKVVAASDMLALDTYISDLANPDLSDPTYTVKTIRFWYETYARPTGREVVVCENGFSTITQVHPDITREDRNGKYTGTEAQQADYFGRLFPKLLAANRDGVFDNKLRGYHLWSIIDNDRQPDNDGAHHLGLYRLDGSAKPAAAVVQSAIRGIEADDFHRPTVPAELDDGNLWGKLRRGEITVDLVYAEGDNHDFLRYTDVGPGSRKTPRLSVTVAQPGYLLLRINEAWMLAGDPLPTGTGAYRFDVDMSTAYRMDADAANTIDIRATATVFPVRQQVLALDIAYLPPGTASA